MSTISQPMRYYNKTTTMLNNQHRTNLELKTHVSRVVVVAGLSHASRGLSPGSPVFLMAAAEGALNMTFDLATLICVLRNLATFPIPLFV